MDIAFAESDAEIRSCFTVMRHLRDVSDETVFLHRVRAQQRSGYRLLALYQDGLPCALAGLRVGESLAWGRYVYVEDLVTLPEKRSGGYGSALLRWIYDFARSEGATQVHLDSGKDRSDAHRFYRRAGMDASSLHFKHVL